MATLLLCYITTPWIMPVIYVVWMLKMNYRDCTHVKLVHIVKLETPPPIGIVMATTWWKALLKEENDTRC